MRVTVLGTSNSLMEEGWLNLIAAEAESHGIRFDNRSVGGSSSRYGAFLTATHGRPRRDETIVYDYAIPDQMFLDAGWLGDEDILGHYLTIAQSLIAARALDRGLILLLPHQAALTESPILDRITALLTDLGLRFIDFRPVLAKIMAETGMSAADLYNDPRHFAPGVQQKIGEHVLANLRASRVRWRHTPAARKLQALPAAGYGRLRLSGLPDQPVMAQPRICGTRLISMPVQDLREGERLGISGSRYLIGALIWTQEMSGSVTIRGREAAIRLHLRRAYKNYFLFDSLTEPLELGSEAELQVANPKTVPSQKALGLNSSIYDHDGATCEIALLVGCDIPPRVLLQLFDEAPEPPSGWRRFLTALRRWR